MITTPFFSLFSRYYSERLKKIVIARSEALHHMVFKAKRRGNLVRLLHGVYPEQDNEILRFAQNDKRRRVRNETPFCHNLIQAVHYNIWPHGPSFSFSHWNHPFAWS